MTATVADSIGGCGGSFDGAPSGATFDPATSILTWTGDIAAGATETVTYTATVHAQPTGDLVLPNSVVSDVPGSSCPPGNTDSRCATGTAAGEGIGVLHIVHTASPTSVTVGQSARFTTTVTNTGKGTYDGARLVDDLAGIMPNGVYNGDATADVGTITSGSIIWTGTLAPGQTATITFTVIGR